MFKQSSMTLILADLEHFLGEQAPNNTGQLFSFDNGVVYFRGEQCSLLITSSETEESVSADMLMGGDFPQEKSKYDVKVLIVPAPGKKLPKLSNILFIFDVPGVRSRSPFNRKWLRKDIVEMSNLSYGKTGEFNLRWMFVPIND